MSDGLDGIDVGDLSESLDRIAAETGKADIAADDALPLRSSYDGGFCLHDRAYINEGRRRVICRKCDAELDAFDFLVRLARESDRIVSARKDAQRRTLAAEERLDEMLRQERNARARLARLKRRLG